MRVFNLILCVAAIGYGGCNGCGSSAMPQDAAVDGPVDGAVPDVAPAPGLRSGRYEIAWSCIAGPCPPPTPELFTATAISVTSSTVAFEAAAQTWTVPAAAEPGCARHAQETDTGEFVILPFLLCHDGDSVGGAVGVLTAAGSEQRALRGVPAGP